MKDTLKRFFAVLAVASVILSYALPGLCAGEAESAPQAPETEQAAPPPVNERQPFPPYLTGQAADKELYGYLVRAREAIQAKNLEEARTQLKELVGKCSDLGITSYEALSAALTKDGKKLEDANDIAGAMLMFDYAILISPNYPPSYFAKGWSLLSQNKMKLLVASDSFIEGISNSIKDFWWSYTYIGNKATSLLFSLAALFTLFGLFIAIRYTPLLAHDIAEKTGDEERETFIKYIALPAIFLLVLIFLGCWWAVTLVLVFLWLYFNRTEKVLAVLFFVLLVFMPYIMTRYASFVQGGGDKTLWALTEVNKGRVEPGTEEFLKQRLQQDPADKTTMMSLAQLYAKQRGYDKAAALYEQLIAQVPNSPVFLNNLGNVYFLMGNYDKAVSNYKAAIEAGKDRALPHFNLSQAYGEMLMFTERNAEDSKASKIDQDLVSTLRSKEGGTPLRMVFDEKVQNNTLWSLALASTPESRELASSLWSTVIKVMPLEGASYAGIGFIVLVLALNSLRRNKTFAHFCEKCGKVSCRKCQRPVYSKELCSQCHQIFVKLDGVEAKDRLKKTLEIREKETRDGLLYRISSLLLPGSGHYLMGNPLRGFVFSGIFIFLVKDTFFGRFLEIPYAFSLNIIGPDTVLMVFLLVVFYVITQVDIYRITKK